jgi:hypothetical protein
VAGESTVAGLAAVWRAAKLSEESIVLVIGTEGATDATVWIGGLISQEIDKECEALVGNEPQAFLYQRGVQSAHNGCSRDDSLVAAAAVCRELLAEQPERQAWRLRGMAVLPA